MMSDDFMVPMSDGDLTYAMAVPPLSEVTASQLMTFRLDGRGTVSLADKATDDQLRSIRDQLWEAMKRIEDGMEDRGMFARRTPPRGQDG
jgi:hypothetical protein